MKWYLELGCWWHSRCLAGIRSTKRMVYIHPTSCKSTIVRCHLADHFEYFLSSYHTLLPGASNPRLCFQGPFDSLNPPRYPFRPHVHGKMFEYNVSFLRYTMRFLQWPRAMTIPFGELVRDRTCLTYLSASCE